MTYLNQLFDMIKSSDVTLEISDCAIEVFDDNYVKIRGNISNGFNVIISDKAYPEVDKSVFCYRNATRTNQVEALQCDVITQKIRGDALLKRLDASYDDIRRLTENNDELHAKVLKLEASADLELAKRNNNLAAKVGMLGGEKNNLEREISRLKTSYSELREKFDGLSDNNAELIDKKNALDEQVKRSIDNLNNWRDMAIKAQLLNACLTSKLENLEAKYAALCDDRSKHSDANLKRKNALKAVQDITLESELY